VPNDQVKGRRHAVPESEANDLNRLLDVLRCANFETMQLRFEADCTVPKAKHDEYIVAISLTKKQF
jgi:hypothetical protein